ncbi:unnamed protein product [Moneuplotes crassus]|uniref:SAM domain-containing protein n=1 Tax=Euplotes crassus TaxID=5936 RepID=A0AAD1U8P7_EUPCR|nr:unnamed protein product [Moneuplotes crassus]
MEALDPCKTYERWTIEDVCSWLENTVSLPQYKTIFAELAIDGSLLPHILDDDLQNDFSIKIRLHRIKIIEAIKKLNSESRKIEEEFASKLNIGDQDIHSEEEKESKYFILMLCYRRVRCRLATSEGSCRQGYPR